MAEVLFVGWTKREFTPAVWLEIQKLSVLGNLALQQRDLYAASVTA